ncbi:MULTISPECIES: DUF3397 domain-containing protein [Enterococcus]|uniref:DUF3397 domain-containing protein n=1 Tax=Enterococcus TaxID=1350 RepID=UPI0025854351|nr:DUF3397 domain-containing protein [uncultured Enterococcus sp.]
MSGFGPAVLFWYIFPLVVFFACRFLVSALSLKERFGLKAPDLAVPFLVIGIHQLSKITFEQSITPYYLISILLLGILLAVFQAYYYEEIQYGRYIKMYWRSIFLFTLIFHVVLIILNIVTYL